MSNNRIELHPDCRLVTYEILYHLPDFKSLIGTFIWQEYDLVPRLPVLRKLIMFWNNNLEGPINSVRVTYPGIKIPRTVRFAGSIHTLN